MLSGNREHGQTLLGFSVSASHGSVPFDPRERAPFHPIAGDNGVRGARLHQLLTWRLCVPGATWMPNSRYRAHGA